MTVDCRFAKYIFFFLYFCKKASIFSLPFIVLLLYYLGTPSLLADVMSMGSLTQAVKHGVSHVSPDTVLNFTGNFLTLFVACGAVGIF